jgi:hypothetical protein
VNDREVERSERDIAQAKHAAKTSGMGAKARLQALQFACVFAVSVLVTPLMLVRVQSTGTG